MESQASCVAAGFCAGVLLAAIETSRQLRDP
jgi:hypothetical protein